MFKNQLLEYKRSNLEIIYIAKDSWVKLKLWNHGNEAPYGDWLDLHF
jgi:hypothetical protein